MVEYMSSTISDWGNHASMEMYGYRKFTEDHYWPVQVDRTAARYNNSVTVFNDLYEGYTAWHTRTHLPAQKHHVTGIKG